MRVFHVFKVVQMLSNRAMHHILSLDSYFICKYQDDNKVIYHPDTKYFDCPLLSWSYGKRCLSADYVKWTFSDPLPLTNKTCVDIYCNYNGRVTSGYQPHACQWYQLVFDVSEFFQPEKSKNFIQVHPFKVADLFQEVTVNFIDFSAIDEFSMDFGDNTVETLYVGSFKHRYMLPGVYSLTAAARYSYFTDLKNIKHTITVREPFSDITIPQCNYITYHLNDPSSDPFYCRGTISAGQNLSATWDFHEGIEETINTASKFVKSIESSLF